MGMFSPYNNREEWVCTNDHPLWSEQEIEFDFQSMTTIFIDEWVNPGRTLSHKYFDEERFCICFRRLCNIIFRH